MERRLKERLIGAAVLALAAVIFIPMILDNTSRRDSAITETNIPKRPDEDFSSRVVPMQKHTPEQPADAAKQPAETPPQEAKTEAAPSQETKSAAAASTPAQQKAPAQSEVPAKPKASSTTAQTVQDESRPAPTGNSSTASTPTIKSGSAVPVEEKSAAAPAQRGLPEWVVQIGSFSNKANAERLIKKLRDGNYHAFVETATQDARTVYRVRVGPELRRSRAESLKEKLTKELKMQGMLVMQYP